MRTFLHAGTVVRPDRVGLDCTIVLEDNRVIDVTSGRKTGGESDVALDWRARTVVPAFIDAHVHGVSGTDVLGRLYVHRGGKAWLVLDVALLPQYRGEGIGTQLLRQVVTAANLAGKPVQIHVERMNPARRLYQRLGFEQVDDQGIYLLLERPIG